MDSQNGPTVNVGVKRVPQHVWQRARHNAIASGLAFREYLIRLMATCTPVGMDAAAVSADQPIGTTGVHVSPSTPAEGDRP